MSERQAATTTPDDNTVSVTLDTPIQRGSNSVTSLVLRKPKTGELRGVQLASLLQMDGDQPADGVAAHPPARPHPARGRRARPG
jgi:hypothetical protein